jgi:hypothetical protein
MKKIWIIVGIIVLVAAVDILVRVFWPEKTDSSVTTPQAPVVTSDGTGAAVDGDVDRTGPIGGVSKNALAAATRKELLKDRIACESVADIIRTKKGRGVTKKDLKPLDSIKQIFPKTVAIDAIFEYHTCLALTKTDFEYCSDVEALLGADFEPIGCRPVFELMTAASAALYRKIDEQRYKAELVKVPADVRDLSLALYAAIKKGDDAICDTLNAGEIAVQLCKMATDPPSSSPDSDDGKSIYYAMQALRTAKREYVEKIVADAARLFTEAMLGDPNVCESYVDAKLKKSCQVL